MARGTPSARDWRPKAPPQWGRRWFVGAVLAAAEPWAAAGYERRGQEQVARDGITRLGFDVYLPHERIRRNVAGGKITEISQLAFPGYFFVRMDLDEDDWKPVRYCKAVHKLMGCSATGRPLPLPTGLVEGWQAAGDTITDLTIRYQHGDKIVVEWMCEERAASVKELRRDRVLAVLSCLGREIDVNIPLMQTRPAA